jgi:DNA-binding transcriptional LysR family regulator
MRPTFDLEALRALVVGTELKSFARAAVQLGRSQSAISMQLKKLEEQAGQQLLQKSGRGLVPTEAGDALLTYARQIVALHDEAAVTVGAAAPAAAVRMGLPQDFFEDLMPAVINRFTSLAPGVHVDVRAGRNYVLETEINAGRLDAAIAFFPPNSEGHGTLVTSLPMLWLAGDCWPATGPRSPLPLVLNDHPCLFRQAGLHALEHRKIPWRLALTTPSLPGVWASLRAGIGVSVRTTHRIPDGIRSIGPETGLPPLPLIELRLLTAARLSASGRALAETLIEGAREIL